MALVSNQIYGTGLVPIECTDTQGPQGFFYFMWPFSSCFRPESGVFRQGGVENDLSSQAPGVDQRLQILADLGCGIVNVAHKMALTSTSFLIHFSDLGLPAGGVSWIGFKVETKNRNIDMTIKGVNPGRSQAGQAIDGRRQQHSGRNSKSSVSLLSHGLPGFLFLKPDNIKTALVLNPLDISSGTGIDF